MDLNEVAVFIQVVQSGSFSAAAKKLGMPNSTVSHKVSSLEKRLRVTLIQRTTRKLNITPAGKAYYARCLQGVEELRAAEMELAALQGEPQGLLRITAPVEFSVGTLPDLVAGFVKRFPKVQVETILTDRKVDLLSENVDLAIRAGELKDSSLIVKRIGTVYFSLVASPKYLKAHGTPEHPRELKDHSCIVFTPFGTSGQWRLVGPRGAQDFLISVRLMANDMMTVARWSILGEGIALLPAHLTRDAIRDKELVPVLSDWKTVSAPLQFVYPAQRFVTPKISKFIEVVERELSKRLF